MARLVVHIGGFNEQSPWVYYSIQGMPYVGMMLVDPASGEFIHDDLLYIHENAREAAYENMQRAIGKNGTKFSLNLPKQTAKAEIPDSRAITTPTMKAIGIIIALLIFYVGSYAGFYVNARPAANLAYFVYLKGGVEVEGREKVLYYFYYPAYKVHRFVWRRKARLRPSKR